MHNFIQYPLQNFYGACYRGCFAHATRGVTEKTRQAYLRAYLTFTEYLKWLDPLPTDWETCLVLFRGFLAKTGLVSQTITSYVSGARNWLKLTGNELRENHDLMKQMHHASQRQDKERTQHPICKELLHKLIPQLRNVVSSLYEQQLFSAVFLAAYYGMFRISELVGSPHALRTRNVGISNNDKLVHCYQHFAKNMKLLDPPRLVELEASGGEFCPCKVLREYSRARVVAARFWDVSVTPFFVHENGHHVMKQQVLKVLRKCVTQLASLEMSEFGTHSFHSGQATDLFLAGWEDAQIKRKGNWTSRCFNDTSKSDVCIADQHTSDDDSDGEAAHSDNNTVTPEASPEKGDNNNDRPTCRSERRIELPCAGGNTGQQTAWIITDSTGFRMLCDFKSLDVGNCAKHIWTKYHVIVQEAIKDQFEPMHAELQLMLELEEELPDVILIHCGAVYLGNPNYS